MPISSSIALSVSKCSLHSSSRQSSIEGALAIIFLQPSSLQSRTLKGFLSYLSLHSLQSPSRLLPIKSLSIWLYFALQVGQPRLFILSSISFIPRLSIRLAATEITSASRAENMSRTFQFRIGGTVFVLPAFFHI